MAWFGSLGMEGCRYTQFRQVKEEVLGCTIGMLFDEARDADHVPPLLADST
jgi:hypothetical protein